MAISGAWLMSCQLAINRDLEFIEPSKEVKQRGRSLFSFGGDSGGALTFRFLGIELYWSCLLLSLLGLILVSLVIESDNWVLHWSCGWGSLLELLLFGWICYFELLEQKILLLLENLHSFLLICELKGILGLCWWALFTLASKERISTNWSSGWVVSWGWNTLFIAGILGFQRLWLQFLSSWSSSAESWFFSWWKRIDSETSGACPSCVFASSGGAALAVTTSGGTGWFWRSWLGFKCGPIFPCEIKEQNIILFMCNILNTTEYNEASVFVHSHTVTITILWWGSGFNFFPLFNSQVILPDIIESELSICASKNIHLAFVDDRPVATSSLWNLSILLGWVDFFMIKPLVSGHVIHVDSVPIFTFMSSSKSGKGNEVICAIGINVMIGRVWVYRKRCLSFGLDLCPLHPREIEAPNITWIFSGIYTTTIQIPIIANKDSCRSWSWTWIGLSFGLDRLPMWKSKLLIDLNVIEIMENALIQITSSINIELIIVDAGSMTASLINKFVTDLKFTPRLCESLFGIHIKMETILFILRFPGHIELELRKVIGVVSAKTLFQHFF